MNKTSDLYVTASDGSGDVLHIWPNPRNKTEILVSINDGRVFFMSAWDLGEAIKVLKSWRIKDRK